MIRRGLYSRGLRGSLGLRKTLKALGIARGLLHSYIHRYRRIPDGVVEGALRFLEESEFNEIVQGIDRLRTIGIIRGDYSIDYPNTTGYCTSHSRLVP
jgi:hypothetical protein